MSEYSVSHECEPSRHQPSEADLAAAARLLDPQRNLSWDLGGELQDSVVAAESELEALRPNRYVGSRELGLAGFSPLSPEDSLEPGGYVMQRVEPELLMPTSQPESIPMPPATKEVTAEEEKSRLNDEQVDRVLLPIIRKTFGDASLDAKKIAAIAAKHREVARGLMENHEVSAGEVVIWLEVAIRDGERDTSSHQPAAKAERRPVEDPVVLAQAARFTELVGMVDRRQRDLGAIDLIAEMAAAEKNAFITDLDVKEIAERLKPVLDSSLLLFPKEPEKSIKSLRGAIKASIEQLRRRGETTGASREQNG